MQNILYNIRKIPLIPVCIITKDAERFVEECAKVRTYKNIPCSERRLIAKEEMIDLAEKLHSGYFYIIHTYQENYYTLKFITRKKIRLETVTKKESLFPNITRKTYKKLYGDKWENCKHCPSYNSLNTNPYGCSLSKKIRTPYLFVFRVR